MIPPQWYIFFIIFFKVESINTLISSNDSIWILQNILQMKSWQNDKYDGLPKRDIFVNGQITTLHTILYRSPIVKEDTIDKISSAIYMSLECRLSNNLMKLLNQEIESNVPIEDINDIFLKIISVFLDLINISPNVVSHEPGFLTTSLSINLHIKKTINLIKAPKINKENNYFIDRKYRHMLNMIERFVILNCPLDDDFEYQMFHRIYSDMKPSELIKNINDSLKYSGLKTTTVLEIKTNLEQTHNNDNFITIIILVLKQLSTTCIMSVEDSILDKINDIENDFSDILLYMHLIFDSIMQIMYEHTLETLESLRTALNQHEKYSKNLKAQARKWTDKGLINIYKQLIIKSQLMQFPMYFTIHLKFLLRIVNDMIYYKNIRNLKILYQQTKEYLINLQNKYRQGLELLPSKNNSGEHLWKILEKILSINEFKNFNLIFKLQQNYGPVEYDSTEIKLNKMKYLTEKNINSEQLCNIIQSLYSHCFNIKIFIEKFKLNSKFINELKTHFSSFLEAIKKIGKSVPLKFVNENFRTIFLLLNRYFGDDTIDYTYSEMIFKKVIYFTMNLLDKYKIHSCETLVHRNEMYLAYNEKPEILIPNFEHFKIEHTDENSEIKNPVQTFLCNENVEENQTFAMLQNNFIDRFYNPNYRNPLFYWKGELKTFKFILDDVKTNYVLDFPLFTKYVNIFHKWIVSVLFYTMIDVLKYFLKEKHNRNNNKLFTAYVKNLQNINFPTYSLPIINTIIKAENFYEPVDIIEFQILLEDHVKQYSKIKRKDTRSNTMSDYMAQLEDLFVKLLEKYDDIYIGSEPIKNTVNSKNFKKATQNKNIENTELKESDSIDKINSNDSKLNESNSKNNNDKKNSKSNMLKNIGIKSMNLINKIGKKNSSTNNPK